VRCGASWRSPCGWSGRAHRGLHGDRAPGTAALINRSGASLDLDEPLRAREDLDRAEQIVSELNSPSLFGLLKANRARLEAYEHPEVSSEALELLEASKTDFDRVGDQVQSSRIGGMLEDLYRSGLEREHNAWSYIQRRMALQKLANLAAERGDLTKAIEMAEEAKREALANGDAEGRLVSQRHVAHWLVLKDNHERAKWEVDEALSEIDQMHTKLRADVADEIRCDLLSLLGQCQRRLGVPAAAAASYRKRQAASGTNLRARSRDQSGFIIKRYRCKGARVWLQAENPAFRNIELTEESAFEVWGVIAKSIRLL
jgi:hypothetical protein